MFNVPMHFAQEKVLHPL